ncbi:MAG: carbohydrate binding family 9 domain-containing protein [Acidobacteriia bacterium]|nr:carbohydrate binding family 9 domain-containing protein [Terriglobia bacterium]
MREPRSAALLFCALGHVATTLATQANGQPPRVLAGRATSPIQVDAFLNEPAWRDAGVIADLSQQSPRPGASTPYRTEVRVLVDDDTLYLGITCFDPDPSRVAVHTMQRDGDLTGDDTVAIILDPFGDRTTGYFFQLNAAGARQDGVYSDPENIPLDWDGIWDARARLTTQGWTAEIAIPSRSLRFPKGQTVWGFNVERRIAHDRVVVRWAGTTLDSLLGDLRRAGELSGVENLRQGKGWSVSPYGLARSERDFTTGQATTSTDGGLDVSYSLGPGLTGVFTLNTDFAETEVDTRQINLTRFPLFYPEKRQFFNDGSNQFSFGLGLEEEFIPFFSRRAGLLDGQQVPIRDGIKLVGRQDRWGIGVLDVQTEDIPAAPGSNLFAGRVTYDVDQHLRLGAIATDGNPDGVHDNSLVGVDAVWRTSTFHGDKNFAVGVWGVRTDGDVPTGKRGGYGLKIDYPNDLWDVSVTYTEFGDGLDPALGFLPRPGTQWYTSGLSYQPRPQHGWWAGWVRQFKFELEPQVVTDLKGTTQSWSVFTAPVNVEMQSGDGFEVNWQPQFERLDAPFEIAKDVVIPAGSYRFDRFRAEVDTSLHRPWQSSTQVWFGTFYTGRMVEWIQSLAFTMPGGHLQLKLSADNAFGHLPQGGFAERVWQLNVVFAFTPDLLLSAYAQYDNDSDNLGVNTRLRWTVKAGTDLYVVWNHGWLHPEAEERWSVLRPISDQAVVKLRYTWRS